MNRSVTFSVSMLPLGKARPRASANPFQGGPRFYTPKKTVEAERLIGWEAKKAMGGEPPLEGPLALEWTALFPYPKSWPKRKIESTYWHTIKPDKDNIEKLIKDSLKGVAWKDDCQVCKGESEKRYDKKCGIGRIVVTIREVL